MIVLQVPHRRYEEAVQQMDRLFRSAWAIVDIRPGRSYGVHADPWESTERLLRAEDVLRALREALKGGGNA